MNNWSLPRAFHDLLEGMAYTWVYKHLCMVEELVKKSYELHMEFFKTYGQVYT